MTAADFNLEFSHDLRRGNDRAAALRLAALVEQAIAAGTVKVREITPEDVLRHNDAGKDRFDDQQRKRQRNGALKSATTNAENYRRRRQEKALADPAATNG